MELKKSKKVDLEKRKGMFIEIGLVVTLAIVLVAFEWTKGEDKGDDTDIVQEIQFEDEMMQITRREEPKPEPKPEQPKVAEVLDIVDDDVEIEDEAVAMEGPHVGGQPRRVRAPRAAAERGRRGRGCRGGEEAAPGEPELARPVAVPGAHRPYS